VETALKSDLPMKRVVTRAESFDFEHQDTLLKPAKRIRPFADGRSRGLCSEVSFRSSEIFRVSVDAVLLQR
jgi:hypothetical protein